MDIMQFQVFRTKEFINLVITDKGTTYEVIDNIAHVLMSSGELKIVGFSTNTKGINIKEEIEDENVVICDMVDEELLEGFILFEMNDSGCTREDAIYRISKDLETSKVKITEKAAYILSLK